MIHHLLAAVTSAVLLAACLPGGGNMPFFGQSSPGTAPAAAAKPAEPAPFEEDEPTKKETDYGKTCHKNSECMADACFTGRGDLGYCTSFCNSFSDCPSFWECKRPGNAPQKICIQDD